ncbi:MAG TPA: Na+/H+ antiporter NhaC family protein [Flavobacteriaceae bacterium]|nr:Na+/H+ antiporter NhaC family protein [Flavobacteriaceae bacterium]
MQDKKYGNPLALLPLLIFVLIYLGGSWYLGDFYQLPVLSIFLLALLVAFVQFPKVPFTEKLKAFAKGAGEETLLVMLLIFLLAGAFSEVSKQMGAVTAVVDVALSYIPSSFLIAGFFIIGSFISISIGTSVGTVAILTPLALEMQHSIGAAFPVLLAAIVGGAMFGDNLSFISDTTIAATKTQGISMREKFRVNLRIVLVPAILTLGIYLLYPVEVETLVSTSFSWIDLIKMLPYLLVFILAVLGGNVIVILCIALCCSMLIGWILGSFTVLESIAAIQTGLEGMLELSILCLIIGGVVGIIRYNGGIAYLLQTISKRLVSQKHAELGIAFLTGIVNLCTANNTIAILVTGPVAREIAADNKVAPARVASIMDTISCFIQGSLPYGAQILTVLSLIGYSLTPFEIIRFLYYPFLIGAASLVFILFPFHKTKKIKL